MTLRPPTPTLFPYTTLFRSYSSNKVLQEELDKIGKAGAYGLWTASVGTMPIGGTAGTVLSVTGLSQSRSEEHTSELQSLRHLVCRLLLEKKNKKQKTSHRLT